MSNQTSVLKDSKLDVRQLVTMAMLSAIGVVLMAVVEVPLFPAAPFLKYDPSDIPILIGTLIYGPVAGLIMTVLVGFIQSFMVHGSGGVIGFVMDAVATGATVLIAGYLYQNSRKSLISAAIALAVGVLIRTAAMAGMNLVLTPIFMGVPIAAVKKMLLPTIIPFNLVKAGLNSAATFIVYKYVEKAVRRNA